MGAHDAAQIHRMLLAETEQQASLGGEAHPVAGVAEIMAMWRNKADTGGTARDAKIACRAAACFIAGLQGKCTLQIVPDAVTRIVGFGSIMLIDHAKSYNFV